MPPEDDNEIKPPKAQYIIGSELEEHSVEALKGFAEDLRREIERIERAILKKGDGRKAAENLFKK